MNPRARQIATFVVFVCMMSVITLNAQTTWHVPADQATIQGAINAANNGDTVLVDPGTYIENINFGGKAITVTSSGGSAVTFIDGSSGGTVVTFSSNEGANSVLSGFTIRNGRNLYAAGGIQITSASPTITGNIITANHSPSGLGITVYGGSPLIKNNTITANTQIGSSGAGGGGIYTSGPPESPATPTIIGNTITNNSVAGGGPGGGISAGYFGIPVIQNNIIQGNAAYNGGAGIYLFGYDGATVVQNLIVGNTTYGGGSGAGIYLQGPSTAKNNIANNTIAGNSATDNTSGIFVAGLAKITNNIVIASSGQTAITCPGSAPTPGIVFSHNNVYSPSGQSWSGVCDSTTYQNISADPQFVANGDYHLQAISPSIDAGDNSAQGLPQTDLDGNPRILDGNNDCVSTIDMGAYEIALAGSTASFSPTSISFPDTLIGTSSGASTATLTNTGAACFQFSNTQITGSFSQVNTCSTTGVAGGSSCTYSVIFTPTSPGSQAGTLSVSGSDGTTTKTLSVALSGNGLTPPSVSVAPSSLSFGNQAVNTSSAAQSVVVTNSGNSTLNISSITATGPFSQTNTCGSSLAGNGASCTISIIFTPTQRGAASGSVSISDIASGSPHVITLAGNGQLPAGVSLTPASLTFASQTVGTPSAPQTVTMTNTGDVVLNITGIAASGTGFSQTNNCGATLAGGASCAISVVFTPTASGTASGLIVVNDSASSSPQQVSLTGTGIVSSPATISFSPTSLTFQPQTVGTTSSSQTITVKNTGSVTLSLYTMTTTGAFAQSNNTCPNSLKSGFTCSVAIVFHPTASGAQSGSLQVTDSASGSPHSVAFSGTGVDFSVSASPASLSIVRGNSGSSTITVSPVGGTFSSAVSLSCSGLPSGGSCSFSPSSVTPKSNAVTSHLTLATSSTTLAGTYTVTVKGASGGLQHSANVTLVVQ